MRPQIISSFSSAQDWKKYCFGMPGKYFKIIHFKNWTASKKIHIINFSNLKESKLKCIEYGIKEAIGLTGLKFEIIRIKNKKDYKKFVDACVDGGKISSKKLLKGAIKKRKYGGVDCADIFILNYPIYSNGVIIRDGEALSFVPEGVSMFTFDSKINYPNSFLKKRAKHESLHLLGLNAHHEDTKVKGYKQDVLCNMLYNAPSEFLCAKCKNAIVSFWRGVENAK